jgi:hypothetical protein
VGPRAGQDRCGKSRPHWDSIPGPSSVASSYTDYAIGTVDGANWCTQKTLAISSYQPSINPCRLINSVTAPAKIRYAVPPNRK